MSCTTPNPTLERVSPRSGRAPQLYVRHYANHANFFCLVGCFFVAGFVVSSILVASSLLVELLVLPVRLLSRVLCFGVLRSSLFRSLLHHASSVLSCGGFSPFCWQRSVAVLVSNFTLKRDAAKARRPLAQR